MRAAPATLGVALCFVASIPAASEDKAARPAPLTLVPGAPVEIACTTKAIDVAEEAKASEGALRLRLEAKEPAATWSVVSVDAAHQSSFAFIQREACSGGCPLDVATERGPMLWAPAKTAPEKLEAGVTMALAALDAKTWAIRISSYRDRHIASLEHGECKPAQ